MEYDFDEADIEFHQRVFRCSRERALEIMIEGERELAAHGEDRKENGDLVEVEV